VDFLETRGYLADLAVNAGALSKLISAKIVRQGRYVIFQMAEVAVSRELFLEILRLIEELRPTPASLNAVV
jgi:hypothetical protein